MAEDPAFDTTAEITAPVAGGTDEVSSTTESRSEKLEKGNRRFTRWRRQRAFGAGLLMILGGAVILTPAYLSFKVSNIQIQISTMAGVSTLVIGILLIVCGLMTWFRGEGRILSGVAAMILAIVALPQSNFGGFVIGTLLSLIGGALALAWTPQSKEEDQATRRQKKEDRKARRERRRNPGATTASAAAVLAALTVGVTAHSPEASAQLPTLPDLQLPSLPGFPGGNAGGDAGTTPAVPTSPDLPALPDLTLPTLPDGHELQNQIDGGLESLGVEIPGLNVEPPADVPGLLPIPGNTFTIKADRTAMTPNMKLSVITLDTEQGPKKAFRIDSDKTVLTNLQVQFPNGVPGAQDLGQDTKGAVTTLTGNFHIFIKKMTITAELMGVNTMIPITLDADWAPDQLVAELSKLGIGLPDFLSGKTDILNGTMETYQVMADRLDAPVTEIGPWAH